MMRLLKYFGRMLKYFNRLVSRQDPTSSMRWLMLVNFVFSSILLWGIWLTMCIIKSQVVDLPDGLVTLYLTANGAAISGKVLQSLGETLATKSPKSSPQKE